MIKFFSKDKPIDVIIFVKNGHVESVVSYNKLNVKVINTDYLPNASDDEVIDNLYKNPSYNFYPQSKSTGDKNDQD